MFVDYPDSGSETDDETEAEEETDCAGVERDGLYCNRDRGLCRHRHHRRRRHRYQLGHDNDVYLMNRFASAMSGERRLSSFKMQALFVDPHTSW